MRQIFGIDFNHWRVIFTQLTVTVSFFCVWLILDEDFIKAVPILSFIISYIAGVIAAHYLQCFYESRLAREPYLKAKFASWSFYVAYSQRGFDLFWKAALSAWVWPLIIIAFLFSI